MKVAVVGATGLVGSVMMKVLEEHDFPVTELLPVASESSAGKTVRFKGKDLTVITAEEAVRRSPRVALFSAGGNVSLEWAPRFADAGCIVIDNSSAWRMDPDKKLIVPEINAGQLTARDRIIANPNCSTIQMVVVLNPLHQLFKIDRIVVSTYQSVTGTGKNAVEQLMAERSGKSPAEMAYPHRIDLNVLPHIDVFQENGYTKEEIKMVKETRKIMGDDSLRITATTVRVPVTGGHSESVNVSFHRDITALQAREVLQKVPGVIVKDNPASNEYPMPKDSDGRDEVFVGRIRQDESNERTLNMWIVADNLRKGAATNAVQIARYMLDQGLI